ncbi:MAG: hypothetical protein AB7L92_07330 [Alphaproteobacteria bacterium]
MKNFITLSFALLLISSVAITSAYARRAPVPMTATPIMGVFFDNMGGVLPNITVPGSFPAYLCPRTHYYNCRAIAFQKCGGQSHLNYQIQGCEGYVNFNTSVNCLRSGNEPVNAICEYHCEFSCG